MAVPLTLKQLVRKRERKKEERKEERENKREKKGSWRARISTHTLKIYYH